MNKIQIDLLTRNLLQRKQPVECPFEQSDVVFNIEGDVIDHFAGKIQTTPGGVISKYGGPCLQIRRLHIGREAPAKTGKKALFNSCDFGWTAVCTQNDLFAPLMQVVEQVEKLLLGFLLSAEKLNVIDNQDIYLTEGMGELSQGVVLDGIYEIVRECLTRQVQNLSTGLKGDNLITDGVSQVGFSQSNFSVNEKWVEAGLARTIGDGHTSAARQPIAICLDEAFKRVSGIERRRQGPGNALSLERKQRRLIQVLGYQATFSGRLSLTHYV